MNLHIFSQLIYNKGVNNIQREKDSLSKNGAEKTGYTCKRMKLDPYFIPQGRINSKRIKDF